jgi:hypothetical protein
MHLTLESQRCLREADLPTIPDDFGRGAVDVYFSADVETDGPIPGPFSILSFALVFAGLYDGHSFIKPKSYKCSIYRELRPISNEFQPEALRVNGLDRARLICEGERPEMAMTEASVWVRELSGAGRPVLVAYPLSFDWAFLYWYFTRFSSAGSPFNHSRCFDLKTAFAVKAHVPISEAGRSKLIPRLRPSGTHTHNALDDAVEQAEIFANIFEWSGQNGGPA